MVGLVVLFFWGGHRDPWRLVSLAFPSRSCQNPTPFTCPLVPRGSNMVQQGAKHRGAKCRGLEGKASACADSCMRTGLLDVRFRDEIVLAEPCIRLRTSMLFQCMTGCVALKTGVYSFVRAMDVGKTGCPQNCANKLAANDSRKCKSVIFPPGL